jgi:hypothetical protein
MATLAGMDLGYGSQVQIVKTNYLYVAIKAGDGGTVAQQRDYLELFNATLNKNQTSGGLHPLTCDYIIPSLAGTGNADPKVTGASATDLLLPVMGPSYASLAQQADLAGHQNSAADMGSTANGHILAFIGSGIVNVTISVASSVATIDSAAALDTLVGTGGLSHALTGSLLARTVDQAVDGGVASGNALGAFFPMGDLHTDLAASDNGTPAVELNTLTTSVVYPGNAAGNTPTDLGTVTGLATADSHFIVTLYTLVKAY